MPSFLPASQYPLGGVTDWPSFSSVSWRIARGLWRWIQFFSSVMRAIKPLQLMWAIFLCWFIEVFASVCVSVGGGSSMVVGMGSDGSGPGTGCASSCGVSATMYDSLHLGHTKSLLCCEVSGSPEHLRCTHPHPNLWHQTLLDHPTFFAQEPHLVGPGFVSMSAMINRMISKVRGSVAGFGHPLAQKTSRNVR